ncbi:MAG: two-component system response regulator [Candidatus Omnitrophica bacterium CG11_big_fil_rev_8_21_14_0_20_42_13]|uniref:Two-component system response regulator n=1 Tax=Candidatus Ghiorseimicrobium undicola TaxID=1974746 RepID=A0A2H0LW27_9BACT|nr:MAG: two-component system response regulator [Candidatus Omnitrophica bacterium CG11_big_fil_rev_8_21_14_0_20_42_13]
MNSKKYILIIDDEKAMVERLTQNVERAGEYEVIAAYDGQQGLELAQKLIPDMIITDLMLPKLDGYKICRMLKFSENYKHIPIIIYSGRDHDSDKKLAEECGANAFIPKIDGQDILIEKMRKIS